MCCQVPCSSATPYRGPSDKSLLVRDFGRGLQCETWLGWEKEAIHALGPMAAVHDDDLAEACSCNMVR